MELLYFVLGIVSVGFLYSVVGVFKLKRELRDFQTMFDFSSSNFDGQIESLSNNIDGEVTEIYRTIDSRLDKLENRLTNVS